MTRKMELKQQADDLARQYRAGQSFDSLAHDLGGGSTPNGIRRAVRNYGVKARSKVIAQRIRRGTNNLTPAQCQVYKQLRAKGVKAADAIAEVTRRPPL